MGDMHGAQGGRGKEEDTEGSLTDEMDEASDSQGSPTDSGDSRATSHVSISEEEQETDRWEVVREKEIAKEPMEEEDTELVGSTMMDITLGSIVLSSQEAGWLEAPLDLCHPAGGDGRAEPASTKCGLDTPMEGGDATSAVHEEQREGQSEPPTPPSSPTNSPRWENEPSAEVPKSYQCNKVICYATEAELKSLY